MIEDKSRKNPSSSHEPEFDYLMVGAGLFNAVLTAQFVAMGRKVLVVERRNEIGGNCHTYEKDGITVHKYGAHIFHTSDRKVWEFANRYAEFHQFVNSPVAMVETAKGTQAWNLPFNMNTLTRGWPDCLTPADAERKLEFLRSPFVKDSYANLEEKALSLVGIAMYEMFIKGYTEKQWGKPCTELPPEIITRIPVRLTYDNNYFNDDYQGIPVGGYTKWISEMFRGATVVTGMDYIANKDRLNSAAGTVFYSGRPDELFGYSLGELEYRGLRFETEDLPVANAQGVAVVNYPSSKVPYTRKIEHRHFMSRTEQAAIAGTHSVVSTEYPVAAARGDEAFYPVSTPENAARYDRYLAMKPDNMVFTGRLGLNRYNDMDDTIAQALALAEELT